MKNWKTTANGFLAAIIGAAGPLAAFLGGVQTIQAQMPGHGPANYTLAVVALGVTTAATIARVWIGLLQNDAPPAPATAPPAPNPSPTA
jgi:hypothetical protein